MTQSEAKEQSVGSNRPNQMRVFVLADTHNKLPQTIVDLASDADEIWHLGDVCEPTIADDLEAIGPSLTVVRGNCDWNSDWPLVIDLTREGLKFRLQHFPPILPRLMSTLSCMVILMCRGMKNVAAFSF